MADFAVAICTVGCVMCFALSLNWETQTPAQRLRFASLCFLGMLVGLFVYQVL
jgi:hypothetical protein